MCNNMFCLFSTVFLQKCIQLKRYLKTSSFSPQAWQFYSRTGVRIFTKFSLLKPTGYVMHHQFDIQQLYALPTLYLCVLYLSENKQRIVPLIA